MFHRRTEYLSKIKGLRSRGENADIIKTTITAITKKDNFIVKGHWCSI